MSTINLDIQKFNAGGNGTWTHGVTKSAMESAYQDFCTKIETTKEAILNYQEVSAALEEGWSGQDRIDFMEKFDVHCHNVCDQIDEYKVAVGQMVDKIIAEWESFQNGLIS